MKKRNRLSRFPVLIALLSLLCCIACKKEFEKPQWDTNILAPFAYTELGIQNIVRNGSAQTNSDNSVDLFIRDTLYTLQMDSLVSVETPDFDIYRTLDSIKFDTAPIVTIITLGQIARQMQQSPSTSAAGTYILSNQGTTALYIPGITGITGGPIPINISNVLDEADIKTGFLDITISNGLPLTIQHAEFQISNVSSGAVIAQPVVDNIAPNTSQTVSQDISGKHIEAKMRGDILDMDFAGGFNVKIDTNDAVVITMKVRDVTVSSATAVFPAQNVINDASTNYLLNMGTVRLKEMLMASGFVQIQVSTSLPDTIFFTYAIPGAVKDGIPFTASTAVPPAGGAVTVFNYDMTGYNMDLSGQPGVSDTCNALYNTLVGRINYTGKKVSLALTDFVHVTISLENAKPSYVRGFLGDTTVNISGSIPLTTFNSITGGSVQFDSADVAIVVDNSFGLNGSATINSIVARNGSATATSSSPTKTITAGTDGTPPVVSSSRLALNNATSVVNILPHQVSYSGTLQINPAGFTNNNDYNQFAYAAYPVKAYMEFKMPLSLTANQLQLTDTISLTSSAQLNGALKKGKLNLIVDNGFPFSAKVKAYFLDVNGQRLDSLVSSEIIVSALKDITGKVTESKRTVVAYNLSPGTISNVEQAKSVIFMATFDTGGTRSKIYSDYRIKFKLAGDVQYTVNGQ